MYDSVALKWCSECGTVDDDDLGWTVRLDCDDELSSRSVRSATRSSPAIPERTQAARYGSFARSSMLAR
jgi:hypothetical protein